MSDGGESGIFEVWELLSSEVGIMLASIVGMTASGSSSLFLDLISVNLMIGSGSGIW